MEWKPIEQLPPAGERFGKYWVIVEGERNHSGSTWYRQSAGVARTQNSGFYETDIANIAEDGDMDAYGYIVTHFMEINNPPFPPRR